MVLEKRSSNISGLRQWKLEELTMFSKIFGESHPFCPCIFLLSLLKGLKWKRYLIVSLPSRIIYYCINFILMLCFLHPLSARCSVNMVPGICQYLIWFEFVFLSFIFVNLMTLLIYQADLNCCAMHNIYSFLFKPAG